MKKNNDLSRRDFIKISGSSILASAALAACGKSNSVQNGTSSSSDALQPGEMTYRTNPKTGEKVSLLGYGGMRWPTLPNTGDNPRNAEIDQETVNNLIDYAIAHGVTYFDTSPHYGRGQSERVMGNAFSRHPRESYTITTKMSAFLEEHGDDAYKVSVDMYHRSFEYLQTDYLDYYLIHGAGIGGMDALHRRLLDIGLLDFLLREREAGRIRNLGFSFHGDVEVFNYLLSIHDQVHWDAVQIQCNYCDWRHASGWNVNAEYLYNELDKREIPIIVMEPLLGGRLSRLPDYLVAKLKQREPQRSAASWAFRFVGSHPRIMTVLSGMTYMEHLQDNILTFSPLVPLTQDDYDFLEEIAVDYLRYQNVPCNECNYCMPCPYGIDIPTILTTYNKLVNEGSVPASSQDDDYRKNRRKFLISYARNVPYDRQASHCIGCRQCVAKCPQRINIPQEMQKINDIVEKLKQGTLSASE